MQARPPMDEMVKQNVTSRGARRARSRYSGAMDHHSISDATQWEAMSPTAFVTVRVRATDHEFAGSMKAIALGSGVSVASITAEPVEMIRTENLVHRDPSPYLFLTLQKAGIFRIRQGGGFVQPAERHLVMYDARRPFTLQCATRTDCITLRIPADAIGHARVTPAQDMPTATFAPSAATARILASTMTELLNGTTPSESERKDLGRILTDMVEALLCAADGDPFVEPSILAKLLLDHVDQNVADPSLSPATLAARFAISERYVTALFAGASTLPPAAYIRDRRLLNATRTLAATNAAISDIAYSCGFSDAATFTRAFKRRTGYTPRDWRATLVPKTSLDGAEIV